jgi:hypothetical protein
MMKKPPLPWPNLEEVSVQGKSPDFVPLPTIRADYNEQSRKGKCL